MAEGPCCSRREAEHPLGSCREAARRTILALGSRGGLLPGGRGEQAATAALPPLPELDLHALLREAELAGEAEGAGEGRRRWESGTWGGFVTLRLSLRAELVRPAQAAWSSGACTSGPECGACPTRYASTCRGPFGRAWGSL
jgi:hypothetical protein